MARGQFLTIVPKKLNAPSFDPKPMDALRPEMMKTYFATVLFPTNDTMKMRTEAKTVLYTRLR